MEVWGSSMAKVPEKLYLLAGELSRWGWLERAKFKKELQKCRADLEQLKHERGWKNADEFISKKDELGKLLKQ